jgi:hypothetical protein
MTFTRTQAYQAALTETAPLRKKQAHFLIVSAVVVLFVILLTLEPTRVGTWGGISFIFSHLWAGVLSISEFLAPHKWAIMAFAIAMSVIVKMFYCARLAFIKRLAVAYLLRTPDESEGRQAVAWTLLNIKGFRFCGYGLYALAVLLLLAAPFDTESPRPWDGYTCALLIVMACAIGLLAYCSNVEAKSQFSVGGHMLRLRLRKAVLLNRMRPGDAEEWLISEAGLKFLDELFVSQFLNLYDAADTKALFEVLVNACSEYSDTHRALIGAVVERVANTWQAHYAVTHASKSVGMISEAS